ncbi:DNA photolyase-like protein [Erythrobacter sp. NAP1]|uniref:FAD-binding domain-containing protein n=1 Tax=Erythrobacter sp. NAP1 TaxID=237727 RepID=UPI0000687977|nr:FAD-binding domain-containing protein [Erythrobacter sp. NAP1]EAQ27949.1 DNA photolyase-like protein [Erythrobacter sp. NAP1]
MTFTPDRKAGLDRLAEFAPRSGSAYASNRNYDDGVPEDGMLSNVSQLSPWLHAGLLSEREVILAALNEHGPGKAEKFIAEVFWRVYFKGYLEQRPSVWDAYKQGRDGALIAVENNSGLAKVYEEAVAGRTGIEAFDQWVRELVQTGYLHNHARMWFASVWIFTLKLDWQLGADFFLRHLMDGDAASNTLSWRWVAGLHTKGKNYAARASNIKRYTERRDGGPLSAEGLNEDPEPLSEETEHQRQKLDLPEAPPEDAFDAPFALLLHDEAASHVPLDLPKAPAAVIGAARPKARSTGEVGELAAKFATGAVENGAAEAASAFDCPALTWEAGANLKDLISEVGVERLAVPYLPTGWTRDALMPGIAPLAEAGSTITLLGDLDRLTWPHARAGFFRVKKEIPGILGELGLAPGD